MHMRCLLLVRVFGVILSIQAFFSPFSKAQSFSRWSSLNLASSTDLSSSEIDLSYALGPVVSITQKTPDSLYKADISHVGKNQTLSKDILGKSDTSLSSSKYRSGNFIDPSSIRRIFFPKVFNNIDALSWQYTWVASDAMFNIRIEDLQEEGDNKKLPSAQLYGQCLVPIIEATTQIPKSLAWKSCQSSLAASWTYGRFTVRHVYLSQLCVSSHLKNPWCFSSKDKKHITFEPKYISITNAHHKSTKHGSVVYKLNPHTVFEFSNKSVPHWHVLTNTGFCLAIYKDVPFELQSALLLPCNSEHVINSFTFLPRFPNLSKSGLHEDSSKSHWQKLAFLMSRFDSMLGVYFLEEQCLSNQLPLRFDVCRDRLDQLWFYNEHTQHLYDSSQQCLSRKTDDLSSAVSLFLTKHCQEDSAYIHFSLVNKNMPTDTITFSLRPKQKPKNSLIVSILNKGADYFMVFGRDLPSLSLNIVGDRWLSSEQKTTKIPIRAWTWSSAHKVIMLSNQQNLENQNFYQSFDYSIHLDGLGCLAIMPASSDKNAKQSFLWITHCQTQDVSQKWDLIPELVHSPY